MGKGLGSTALKLRKYLSNVHKKTKKKVHMFNIWTMSMQSLNNKDWKLFKLDITQTRHLSILIRKLSKFKTPNNKKKWNVHKMHHFATQY